MQRACSSCRKWAISSLKGLILPRKGEFCICIAASFRDVLFPPVLTFLCICAPIGLIDLILEIIIKPVVTVVNLEFHDPVSFFMNFP